MHRSVVVKKPPAGWSHVPMQARCFAVLTDDVVVVFVDLWIEVAVHLSEVAHVTPPSNTQEAHSA